MTWIAAHPYLVALLIGLAISAVSSVISLYGDPDNNPETPPPTWVVPFIVIQKIFTFVAPNGTIGIGGTRVSIPLVHYPRAGAAPSGTPPALVLALLSAAMALPGCTLSQAIANSYRGLTVAERIVQQAQEQFPEAAKEKRLAIVEAATRAPDARAALDAWTVTEDRIAKAIVGTDNTVKLCRDAIAEIRKGIRDKAQLGTWIATGIRLGLDLKELLAGAGLPLGGL